MQKNLLTLLKNKDFSEKEAKKNGDYMSKKKWNAKQSDDLYRISGWGQPYFSVNRNGDVLVHPKGKKGSDFNLKKLTDQIVERGISTPFLLRFNDIITHRLLAIDTAFQQAIKSFEYKGGYHTIFPIKVNQQRHVVDQIATGATKKRSFGLEAGSKPELMAVLALSENQKTPIVCNGYKDKEFFEIALMGTKMGKPVYPVIEKFSEFEDMIAVAKKLGVTPQFGVRVKLTASGSGKWKNSGGHKSKFGLTLSEVVRSLDLLKSKNALDGFQLLHFHLGSQITDISSVKNAMKEAARIYVELKKMGVDLKILDVGGGLGVDYDGSQSRHDSSMNYTLQQYANDVIYYIKETCDHSKVEHPEIFTECGRAISAHHSVLVYNVLGSSGYDRVKLPEKLPKDVHPALKELFEVRAALKKDNVTESYHDAVSAFKECLNLFALGYMKMDNRGLAEDIYFSTIKRCLKLWKDEGDDEELSDEYMALERELADTYFCNFSLFQSLPDYWAIDHLFPIIPIHRLNEEPKNLATLADITCDSDGKIDQFIHNYQNESVLPLHPIGKEDYYLGVFLVGAYQETLGDLHNLFGDTNAVHVTMGKKKEPIIETIVKGDTIKEVLTYVQYDVNDLVDKMHSQLENAVRAEKIDLRESGQFLKFYENELEGYTYLEETQVREDF